jgi:hypothetical protein
MTDALQAPEPSTFAWTHPTREGWLKAALLAMIPWLKDDAELVLDPEIAPVMVGWAKGVRGRNPIGACYHPGVAPKAKEVRAIFIFPTIDDPVEVIATLLHEMVHAALPPEVKHKGPFKKAVKALGLAGKATATFAEPGSPLHDKITALAQELGPYPHSKLVVTGPAKKGAGWPRYESTTIQGYKVLVSPKMLDAYGPPLDPNGETMGPDGCAEFEGEEE